MFVVGERLVCINDKPGKSLITGYDVPSGVERGKTYVVIDVWNDDVLNEGNGNVRVAEADPHAWKQHYRFCREADYKPSVMARMRQFCGI